MENKSKTKKRWSTGKKVFLSILGILAIILSIVLIYGFNLANKIDRITYSNEDISVSSEVKEELTAYTAADNLDKIINVALFGIDAADGEAGRSDSIMILTVDPVHNELKVSSIMRDSYVDIPGYGMDKINHAFAFGNSVLALNTINSNFGLNVDNFMAVNFTNLPIIIDKLGGVTINITEEEVPLVKGVTSAGPQLLTGAQTLSYSRIRYASGNDYQRTSRHRTILAAIFNKVKDTEISQLPSLLNEFLPLIQTNFSTTDLISLGTTMINIGPSNLMEDRFPRDGYCEGEMIDGIYYLTFDIQTAKEQMREFMYKN